MKALSALCLAATLSSLSLPAQVVISEINITPQSPTDDQWIELQNLGGTTANISSWSLYLSTAPNTRNWMLRAMPDSLRRPMIGPFAYASAAARSRNKYQPPACLPSSDKTHSFHSS